MAGRVVEERTRRRACGRGADTWPGVRWRSGHVAGRAWRSGHVAGRGLGSRAVRVGGRRASDAAPASSSATSKPMPPASRMASWLTVLPAARFHKAPAPCWAAAEVAPARKSVTSGSMPPHSRIASWSAVVLEARLASAPAACTTHVDGPK